MKKKKEPLTVDNLDKAFRLWNPPVQCGDCYLWYNPRNHDECPNCGGKEWVGCR